jgi:hypothetical protein
MLILTTSALMALIPSIVSGAPAAASPSQLAASDDLSGLSLNSPSTPQTSDSFDFSDPNKASIDSADDEDDFMLNDSPTATANNKIKSTAPFGKKATPTTDDEDFFAALGKDSDSKALGALGSKKLSDTTYTVIIKTGDKFGSGTDAHVFVQLGDAQGNSVNSFLSSHGHFSRKKVDAFKITSSKFLDEVCSLVIGHDNSHFYAPWYALLYLQMQNC